MKSLRLQGGYGAAEGGGGEGSFSVLMGLKNEFLCHLHCKPCTCYLNLTCHKSNSSKQDGTGLLSTFILEAAGNSAGR